MKVFQWKAWLAALLLLPMLALQALARLEVDIDLSSQRMNVKVDGQHYATWPISSGRRGYYTPRGTWRPKWLKRMHYSRKYDNAPMPYSIFFLGGYAIHGTNVISRLGRPASHGCIRLHPTHAADLFELVKRHGRKNTIIRVRGSTEVAYARLRDTAVKKRVAQVKKRRHTKASKARRLALAKQRRYSRKQRARRLAQLRRKRAAARRAYRKPRRRTAPRYEFLRIYGAMFLR